MPIIALPLEESLFFKNPHDNSSSGLNQDYCIQILQHLLRIKNNNKDVVLVGYSANPLEQQITMWKKLIRQVAGRCCVPSLDMLIVHSSLAYPKYSCFCPKFYRMTQSAFFIETPYIAAWGVGGSDLLMDKQIVLREAIKGYQCFNEEVDLDSGKHYVLDTHPNPNRFQLENWKGISLIDPGEKECPSHFQSLLIALKIIECDLAKARMGRSYQLIEKELQRLHENKKCWYSFNNQEKIDRINRSLEAAVAEDVRDLTRDPRILKALSYHRLFLFRLIPAKKTKASTNLESATHQTLY